MDLRSGCSYWVNEPSGALPAEPLSADARADVAIVGGGVTGALASYYLAEAGVSCVLVDRRPLVSGSTAASTGLLQYEVDKPLVELAELVGPHVARRAYQLGKDALDEFARLTRDALADDCGFARTASLLLASGDEFTPLLRAECDARVSAGLACDFLGRAALRDQFGVDRPAALLSRDAARVDPVRLTRALFRRAIGRGLRAFGRTQIDVYESGADGVTLTTDAGHTIHAAHAIFATGYETPEFLRDVRAKLKSTYACSLTGSSQLATGNSSLPLIWETGHPYFYARPAPTGLIVGGEDDEFDDPETRDARLPQKTRILVEKLRRLLPGVGGEAEVDCAWAGTFAETPDALPYVGPHREFPRGLFALGYGGNGITFALIAARLIRDRILGRANADADLFAFDRSHKTDPTHQSHS